MHRVPIRMTSIAVIVSSICMVSSTRAEEVINYIADIWVENGEKGCNLRNDGAALLLKEGRYWSKIKVIRNRIIHGPIGTCPEGFVGIISSESLQVMREAFAAHNERMSLLSEDQ